MNDTPENIVVKTESVQNIANSIRTKNNKTDKYKIGEMSGAIDELPTYIPNSMANVYVNGVHNVAQFEKVSVDVPVPSGAIEITQNGRTDVKDYIYADVNVPLPSGTTTITSNGTYDVTQYSSAVVNTPSYTPDSAIAISTNGQHNVGQYEFANVNVPSIVQVPDGTKFQYSTFTQQGFEEFLSHLDFVNITSGAQMFNNSNTITALPTLRNFKPTAVTQMLSSPLLTSIAWFDSSICQSFYNFARASLSVVDFPEFNTTTCTGNTSLSSIVGVQTYTSGNPFTLTDTSLDNILKMCYKSGITTSSYKKLTTTITN